jgi:hypothetical protein
MRSTRPTGGALRDCWSDVREWLRVSLCKRMEQVSYWKRRETKDRTPKIEVMTNAMLEAPMHPGKQVKCLGQMTEHDNHQTSCTD